MYVNPTKDALVGKLPQIKEFLASAENDLRKRQYGYGGYGYGYGRGGWTGYGRYGDSMK